jgi:hypothetical protein
MDGNSVADVGDSVMVAEAGRHWSEGNAADGRAGVNELACILVGGPAQCVQAVHP